MVPTTTPQKRARAVLIRLDRIGDLILTLPVERHFLAAGLETHWVVAEGLSFVARAAVPPQGTRNVSYTEFAVYGGIRQIWELQKLLRALAPEIVIVFHARAWVAVAVWLSGVKWRFGPMSQWFSFLFFNRGLRQKRSESRRHELDYNEELAIAAIQLATGFKPHVPVSEALAPLRLSAPSLPLPESLANGLKGAAYIVIHAGMAGSARNCDTAFYAKLIEELIPEYQIVMTGTRMDRPYLEPLKEALRQSTATKSIHWMNEKLLGDELLTLLAHAAGVIAPSTGVVHLAASLGVPTIGLYSPVRVQAPLRWGTRGARAKSLAPEVNCPGHFKCLMENCPQFDCMKELTTEMVRTNLKEMQSLPQSFLRNE